jgi:hypothetical protein
MFDKTFINLTTQEELCFSQQIFGFLFGRPISIHTTRSTILSFTTPQKNFRKNVHQIQKALSEDWTQPKSENHYSSSTAAFHTLHSFITYTCSSSWNLCNALSEFRIYVSIYLFIYLLIYISIRTNKFLFKSSSPDFRCEILSTT